MVNIFEILQGGYVYMKILVISAEVEFGEWFQKYGLVKNIFFRVGVGKLLLVKCGQALNNRKKKSSLFRFSKSLYLLDLRICFRLKVTRPWLKFRIRFSQYIKHEIFPNGIGDT